MKPNTLTSRERWMLAGLAFYGAILIAGVIAIILHAFHFHWGTR